MLVFELLLKGHRFFMHNRDCDLSFAYLFSTLVRVCFYVTFVLRNIKCNVVLRNTKYVVHFLVQNR